MMMMMKSVCLLPSQGKPLTLDSRALADGRTLHREAISHRMTSS
jgi:hypothetical protein